MRYDKDRDRKIRFSEFTAAFSSSDPYQADRLSSRKGTGQGLSDKTFLMYRGLWLSHIKVEQQAELIRQKLISRPGFSLFDAFKAVDENNDGKITKDELHRVIEKSGFNVTFDEINTLMDRYDKDGDGAISYTEFSDEIRPHSPYKR